MLESFDNAEDDFRQRQVIEARNEAKTILSALEKGRKGPAWEQLTSDEREKIAKQETALEQVMKRRLPGDSHSDRRAEPGNDATGRVDDGYGCVECAQREDVGPGRYGRRAGGAASVCAGRD